MPGRLSAICWQIVADTSRAGRRKNVSEQTIEAFSKRWQVCDNNANSDLRHAPDGKCNGLVIGFFQALDPLEVPKFEGRDGRAAVSNALVKLSCAT